MSNCSVVENSPYFSKLLFIEIPPRFDQPFSLHRKYQGFFYTWIYTFRGFRFFMSGTHFDLFLCKFSTFQHFWKYLRILILDRVRIMHLLQYNIHPINGLYKHSPSNNTDSDFFFCSESYGIPCTNNPSRTFQT